MQTCLFAPSSSTPSYRPNESPPHFLYLFLSARISEENKLRAEVLESLREHLTTAHRKRETLLASNIETIIQEVANLKKGVYGTWRDQPIWSTILYPLGGVTILSFLD